MGAQPVSPISRFGPSALLTPANLVTALRFALTIPLLQVIATDGVSWRATVGWIILASTDGLDGWLARRDGTTRSGAFLDPLADKFLVLGAMAALVAKGVLWWLPVALIAVREVALSGYRS
ncbi:MAG TPA: CDP-alcohol phosphatidyltransferase family protein, partial [Acidimicrobiia bacterium]